MMGDALVGVVTADEPKISLQATTKDGCDGFTILALHSSSSFARLEAVLPMVDMGDRHIDCCCYPW